MNDGLTVLISLAQNVVLLLALTLVYTLLRVPSRALPLPLQNLVYGFVFGLSGIIALLTPLTLTPGVILNASTPILGIAGAFGGFGGGLLAWVVTGLCRLSIGGAGALPSIGVLFTAMSSGALLFRAERHGKRRYSTLKFLVFGMIIAVQALLWTLTLPTGNGVQIVQLIAPSVLLMFPSATVFFGVLLNRELQRREAEVALRISGAALQAAHDGVIVTDGEGQIMLANPAAGVLFGAPAAALLTLHLPDLIAPESRAAFIQCMADVRVGGSQTLDTTGYRRDNSTFPMQMALSSVRRENDYGVVATIRDTTSQQVAEQRLVELALERSRVTLLHSFIGEASHDLKTPITVLRTSSHIGRTLAESLLRQLAALRTTDTTLLNDLNLTASKIAERMELLDTYGGWLQEMVEDMLDMVRLDHPASIQLSRQDLNQVVGELVARYQPVADAKHVSMSFTAAHALPAAQIDKKEFSRAVYNVIGNAVKYTAAGGSVRVSTTVQNEWIAIIVSDSGVGIPADELPRIFEPFYRSERSRSTLGSGLGLAIARKIITLHGGEITVESREGEGSTFRVLLPHQNSGG